MREASTAAGIQLMMQEEHARQGVRFKLLQGRLVQPLADRLLHMVLVRTVSAKRARFLRRRGDDVRYSRCTSTGKTLYTWTPRAPRVVLS